MDFALITVGQVPDSRGCVEELDDWCHEVSTTSR
jgi:hypothetical protein